MVSLMDMYFEFNYRLVLFNISIIFRLANIIYYIILYQHARARTHE